MPNKIVVIIGASSGIGEATAIRLAGDGHQVVIAARRADRLTQIADRINADGGRATALPVDVTDQAAVAALADSVVAEFGGLDVVVACAGLMPLSPLNGLKLEEWKRMIDVNIRGLLFSIAAVLPQFQRQGGGHFVTIGSTAAGEVVPAAAVYSATKSAARVITEGLRLESDPSIRVTTISPGSPKLNCSTPSPIPPPGNYQALCFKKLAISPDTVAAAISYAVSQPSDVDVNEIVVRPVSQRYGWLAP